MLTRIRKYVHIEEEKKLNKKEKKNKKKRSGPVKKIISIVYLAGHKLYRLITIHLFVVIDYSKTRM